MIFFFLPLLCLEIFMISLDGKYVLIFIVELLIQMSIQKKTDFYLIIIFVAIFNPSVK